MEVATFQEKYPCNNHHILKYFMYSDVWIIAYPLVDYTCLLFLGKYRRFS